MSLHDSGLSIDPRSGFCSSTSTFYSKRKPVRLPPEDDFLDITTFISSRRHSGTVALIDTATGRRVSFPELWSSVEAVASHLSTRLGVRKGDVVLLLSPNSLYFPVVCLSVMSLGAVITTANPLNTAGEIARQIADSKPVLAFTTPQLAPKLAAALPIVTLAGSRLPAQQDLACIEEMMREAPLRGRVRERIRQCDTATLLYSSGTTGVSKGVAASHRNLIAMVLTVIGRLGLGDEDDGSGAQTFVCTVPMFHVYGLALFATGLMATGSTVVVLERFGLEDMASAIGMYGATFLPLVPPILVAMTREAAAIRGKHDLGTLRKVISGGAPLSKEMIEGFAREFPGVEVLQGYGLTETTAIGASTDTAEESMRYGTAGMLSPSMQARIVDPETGEALPVNRTGELWLRGPSVMKGYFSNPEATTSTLDSKGWLRTGDLCYFDEDGFLFVVDRLKELIKYKGYQVAPAELETLLQIHPEITDAAVIPFPDKDAGQYPMAYVVRRAGSNLSDTQIMDFIARQVSPYKRIRRVAFIAAIPKNASGKVLRKDLVKLATSKL